MIKPASLRRAIVAAVPSLKRNPDKLLVFIDQGLVVATGEPSLSFEYRYVLNLVLLDFAGEPDAIMIALVAWVKEHELDLVQDPTARETGMTFEVDQLDHETCDLSIKVRLSESVVVTQNPDGSRTVEHAPEPSPAWPIEGLYAPPGTVLV
jgi:hypothetical protein